MGSARTLTVLRYIGANVRRLRLANGFTQASLAEAANMDLRHLQRVERATVNLTIGALTGLADALGVPPSELFGVADLPPVRFGRPVKSAKTRRRER